MVGLRRGRFLFARPPPRDNWPALQQIDIIRRLETAQAGGRLAYAGFSFHDHYQVLKSIVQAYDPLGRLRCAIQRYMDVDPTLEPPVSAGRRRGLAVVATEPFKGGRLTDLRPKIPPGTIRPGVVVCRMGAAVRIEPPGDLGGSCRYE